MHVRVSRSGLAAHDPRAFSLCVVDAMPYARIFLPNTRCGGARILLICRYPAVGAFPFRVFPNGHHIPGCVSAGQAGTTPRPRGPEAVRTAPGPSTSASSSPFDPRSTRGGGGPTLRHGAGPPPCPSGCRYTTVGQSVSTEGRGDLGRRVQEVRSPQKVHNGEARAVEAVRDLTFERGEGEPGRPVGPFGCHRGARRYVRPGSGGRCRHPWSEPHRTRAEEGRIALSFPSRPPWTWRCSWLCCGVFAPTVPVGAFLLTQEPWAQSLRGLSAGGTDLTSISPMPSGQGLSSVIPHTQVLRLVLPEDHPWARIPGEGHR